MTRSVTASPHETSSERRWTRIARLHLTPARAVRLLAGVTLSVTLASGVAMHLLDGKEFQTIGRGLWWATQTVTTVGYGDVVPHATAGRLVALVVMVCAIAFLTVVTAAVTATLIEHSRRMQPGRDRSVEMLAQIDERLARLEDSLSRSNTTV